MKLRFAFFDQLLKRSRETAERDNSSSGNQARFIQGQRAFTEATVRVAEDLPPMRFPPITDLAHETLEMEELLRCFVGGEIGLTFKCVPCGGNIFLDSEGLLRLLLKLASNSIEAMQTDGDLNRAKHIEISVRRAGSASFLPRSPWCRYATDSVILSFSDNGHGIALHDLPHIFDPSFRVSRRERTQAAERDPDENDLTFVEIPRGAQGRGLLIVRQIVKRAGGSIRVMSACGVGTRFEIELPISA